MFRPGVRVKTESDCFADEIAIDFPSVGHLVARVRASFLAEGHDEHAGMLKTEVCLSSDEAFRGRRFNAYRFFAGQGAGSQERRARRIDASGVCLTVPPRIPPPPIKAV